MKMKFFFSLMLVTLSISFSFASEPIHFDGKSQFIFFNQNEQPSADQLFSILKESGLSENYSLTLLNQDNDLLGMIHYRYLETYNGNPVDNTMWIVHTKNGKIVSMNGVLVSNLPASSQTIIDSETAYQIAFTHVVKSLNEAVRNSNQLINQSINGSLDPSLNQSSHNATNQTVVNQSINHVFS